MDIEEIKVSDEEIQEETEAQKELQEDEIREKVVTDLGIEDNEDNKDLIEKLINREKTQRQKLSKAISQKRTYRDKLNGGKPPVPAKPGNANADPVEAARQAAREEFMQRDLDEMDYSDDIKAEMKELAERKNISIRKAEKDPYIQFRIAEVERENKVNDAAKNGKKGSNSTVNIDVSKPLNPADFDLSTEAGRTEWAEAKKARQAAAK